MKQVKHGCGGWITPTILTNIRVGRHFQGCGGHFQGRAAAVTGTWLFSQLLLVEHWNDGKHCKHCRQQWQHSFWGVSVLTPTWSSAAESFQFAALLLVWFPNPLAKSNRDPVYTAASCTLPSFGVYRWATARTLNDCFLTAFMIVERLFHN